MHKNLYASQAAAVGSGRFDADAVGRREAVIDLVKGGKVDSQASLAQLLRARGYRVTQATLSRDLKALRIGKVPASQGGYVYVLPGGGRDAASGGSRRGWELQAFVLEVRLAGNLAIVRTAPGNGQGAARVIDQLGWHEVVGTVSGDDTILIVTLTETDAVAFRDRLAALVGRRL